MKKITFEYQDAYTHGKWNTQTAICSTIDQMKKFYGLDQPGVKYRIVSVEEQT